MFRRNGGGAGHEAEEGGGTLSRGNALMERTFRFYPADQCFCGPRTIRITWESV